MKAICFHSSMEFYFDRRTIKAICFEKAMILPTPIFLETFRRLLLKTMVAEGCHSEKKQQQTNKEN